MKAEIKPVRVGDVTRYAIFWNGIQHQDFPTVTQAQRFCQDHYIPFKPWE